MKKNLRVFISRYFFSESLPLEGRVLNLVLGFGFFAGLGGVIARIIEGVSFIAIGAVGGMMAVIVITFFVCNKFRIYHLCIWAALIAVCDILFPLVFFTNAGADSGMAGYFVLTIVLIFLLLRGKECAIMLFFHIAIVLGCYLLQRFCPGMVIPFTSDFQKYVDHIQTILISGLFIGLVIKYQTRIYEEEKNKAEAATQAKADFLANVSHELRTPLNAIIGLGELELRKNMEKETYANMEKIHNSGLILLNIINDLLDISKIESGRFELIPVNYHSANFINDTVNLNIVRLGSKPIVFQLEINEALPSAFYGDELRVRQILNNLLSNAFKYTKEGKVILSIDFERIEGESGSVMLVCQVKDTGIGIRQEDLGKLFSVYNQVDTRSNRHIEGTGLGLSICKSLVDMMGGKITVESAYGLGSIFTVKIRQQVSNENPIGRDAKEQLEHFKYNAEIHRERRERVRIKMPYARVLVVDDVATNLDVAKGMMLPYNMTIDCVASGREAIALIREEKIRYNAVFMDHMMPEMDGIEAVRIIRQEIGTEYAKNIPIIALTANAIIGNDKMFLENGFQDYLSKPINTSTLDACLNRWVRDREKEAQLAAAPQAAETKPAEAAKIPAAENLIEGIDFAEGVQRMGGRTSSFTRILTSYAASLPAMLDRIRNFSAESLKDYLITVHGIKGSSYGICAMDVGKQAEALEMAAKQEDIETILVNNGAFIREAEKLVERITVFLATGEEQ
ncbi:MAG: response regulator [Treponema sp.]|jgi:signal transduction histidine kinase/FixJ family two-component response regulator|nr:response regulator [Treponema sp.]